MRTLLAAISVALSVAALAFLLLVPTYAGVRDGVTMYATVLEVNGQWALRLLLFPVLVALAGLAFPARVVQAIAAFLLCGFALIGAFTIGLFYLPAGLAMLMAASVKRPPGAEPARR